MTQLGELAKLPDSIGAKREGGGRDRREGKPFSLPPFVERWGAQGRVPGPSLAPAPPRAPRAACPGSASRGPPALPAVGAGLLLLGGRLWARSPPFGAPRAGPRGSGQRRDTQREDKGMDKGEDKTPDGWSGGIRPSPSISRMAKTTGRAPPSPSRGRHFPHLPPFPCTAPPALSLPAPSGGGAAPPSVGPQRPLAAPGGSRSSERPRDPGVRCPDGWDNPGAGSRSRPGNEPSGGKPSRNANRGVVGTAHFLPWGGKVQERAKRGWNPSGGSARLGMGASFQG